jgi:biopolymer transport protein ExbD
MARLPELKSPRLDMNPMVDMAFLLVTFFMLTTTFKLPQPLPVQTPASFSTVKLPERDVLILSVAPDGRVFVDMDGKFSRQRWLARMGDRYGVSFSAEQREAFGLMSGHGMPVQDLPAFLDLKPEQRKLATQPGVPLDSASNQLADWVLQARLVNPAVRVAIRADRDVPYRLVDGVIAMLLDQNVTRFNLITEQKPDPDAGGRAADRIPADTP